MFWARGLLLAAAFASIALPADAQSVSRYTSIDISGTVTAGGSYQTVAPANSSRVNCTIQNPANATEVLNVKIGIMAQPYVLAAGQSISTLNGAISAIDAISLTAATTAHPFSGNCQ